MPLIRESIFGVRVDVATRDSAAQMIHQRSLQGGGIVCVANVDMLTRSVRDERLFNILDNAFAVVSDGMPLVWRLRSKGHLDAERVYGPQLMSDLCALAARDDSGIFLFGGNQVELALVKRNLLQKYLKLRIVGAVCPPLLPNDPPLNLETVDLINESGANIVFVGLGCPKQEYWMSNFSKYLRPLAIGVGYAFVLTAGLQKQAPLWMRRSGLEWLFRLMLEPRRLWKRYLIGNSKYLWYSMRNREGWPFKK